MPSLILFLECCKALGMETTPSLTLLDVDELTSRHVPAFSPETPAVLAVIETEARLEMARRVLLAVYPATHPVKLVRLSADSAQVADSTLAGMSGEGWTALYLPAQAAGTSFEAFQEIIAHLRAPDGCPWDKEQTHLTLRKHLLEETYETISAMDEQDAAKMSEEFGDLLLQIVLNAQIGSEYGGFTMTHVLKGIYDKIIRRHPHVFGEVAVEGVGDVLSNWEKIKAGEREKAGKEEKGLLDGLPAALPALSQAQEFQDRAARVGFDWPEIDGVLEKVREEIEEVRQSQSPEEFSDELGDLFFALVNLARWKKVDSEAALRAASLKFKLRFAFVEKRARGMNRSMKAMSIEELDALWNEAKKSPGL